MYSHNICIYNATICVMANGVRRNHEPRNARGVYVYICHNGTMYALTIGPYVTPDGTGGTLYVITNGFRRNHEPQHARGVIYIYISIYIHIAQWAYMYLQWDHTCTHIGTICVRIDGIRRNHESRRARGGR